MFRDYIFSYAEDKITGRMVHVDDVPRGLNCNCICPHCHEPLMARHGDEREHGFAHHSQTRKANLEICYQVILYKLAEQIIQDRKRILLPSYYSIFPEREIKFVDVQVDGRFEREDKQPDVIATTDDGQKYLIEFVFSHKVRHHKPIDYANMNCIEINLQNQTLESLHDFLSSKPTKDWRWLNCDDLFNSIESKYAKNDMRVKLVSLDDCRRCGFTYNCCAIRNKNDNSKVVVSNNGIDYLICKTDLKAKIKAEEEERQKQIELSRQQQQLLKQQQARELSHQSNEILMPKPIAPSAYGFSQTQQESIDKSCFNCKNNLSWAKKNGLAGCGCYKRLCIPQWVPPDTAKTCKLYNR